MGSRWSLRARRPLRPRRPFDSRCGAAYCARVIRAGDTFDAVVIGGGPAGSAAAHLLASWSWSVLLVHQRPSRPSLAESLPGSTRKLLALVGDLVAVDGAGFHPCAGT